MKRVVITGLGAITPIGNDVKSYWENLLAGISGADKITRFDTSKFKTNFACEIKNYNALDFFDRKELRKLDRFNQYGIIASNEAIKDSEIDFSKHNRSRIGVIFASGIGGFQTFEEELFNYINADSTPKFNPFFITKIISNSLSGYISIKYGLHGVNYCPVTACASSSQSVIQAFNYIKFGKADLIVTGGSEAPITESSIGGFNSMKAISTNNDNYKTASRPFDGTRDGFVVGEGAGALIVESLDSAIKRKAKIYAEIVGGGESSDAYHITSPHPEGIGAYLAMKNAIEEAGINEDDIDYINAHATSTGLGDLSETKAIERLFSSSLGKLHISGTKSMTGHLLGGTGAIEAIATCLSIQNDFIPPTINTNIIDENISPELNLTLNKKVAKHIQYAMNNNFGFGGHCVSLLLKKYVE